LYEGRRALVKVGFPFHVDPKVEDGAKNIIEITH
jgi:hypothetical protein